jgi:hypothetical protein
MAGKLLQVTHTPGKEVCHTKHTDASRLVQLGVQDMARQPEQNHSWADRHTRSKLQLVLCLVGAGSLAQVSY